MKTAYLLSLFLVASQPHIVWAQMNMAGHAMGTQEQTPPDKLPPPQKMAGVGNAHIQIMATPEAQMWFDQGLSLLHDYWDYESARAFQQAIRVDPNCAMCYWGLYKAESFYHGNSQDYAKPALNNAVRLQDHATKRERLYIQAGAASENVKASIVRPGRSPSLELMRKLVKEYPKETQARIFLSNMKGGKEPLEILESILKESPDDSAANHYYIHALEASPHPEKALHSAEILGRLAPASGHMVHMPGHIFFRVGDYARAEQSFTASMNVDEHYMRDQHVEPDNDWNYVHNLMYAIANLMEEGKFKEATNLSSKLTGARGVLESTLYINSARDSISRLDPHLPVTLRTANWEQVSALSKASKPLAEHTNLVFLAHQLAAFADAMLAIDSRDLVKAEQLSAQFDAELWRMTQSMKSPSGQSASKMSVGPPTVHLMLDALPQPLMSSLGVMSLELRASVANGQGQTARAKSLFEQAAKAEKALGYHEPPNYIRPVRETEAAAMMKINDWTAARTAYERALEERPRSGLPMYGIALCRENAGEGPAAAKAYSDFLQSWRDADRDLTQIAHAETYLASHRALVEKAGR